VWSRQAALHATAINQWLPTTINPITNCFSVHGLNLNNWLEKPIVIAFLPCFLWCMEMQYVQPGLNDLIPLPGPVNGPISNTYTQTLFIYNVAVHSRCSLRDHEVITRLWGPQVKSILRVSSWCAGLKAELLATDTNIPSLTATLLAKTVNTTQHFVNTSDLGHVNSTFPLTRSNTYSN